MNQLKHHGVIGMKWGLRRFQNSDGTLTSAGKKKLANDRVNKYEKIANNTTNISRETKNISSTYYKNKRSKVGKMDLDSMTDQELREKINRALLEKQYNETFNPKLKYVDVGRDRVSNILDTTTSALAITSSALGIALAIKQLKD